MKADEMVSLLPASFPSMIVISLAYLPSMNSLQLLHNPVSCRYNTWTRWGRVGERGQHALLGAGSIYDAQSQFEKKFKDKTGLKWADRAGDVKAGKCELQVIS